MSTDAPQNKKDENEIDPMVRTENEDDDGYDPWSDRRYEEPLFEPDPWN